MAGSATAPSTSEETVMPSWAVAIIAERCSRAHRVICARLLPCARGRFDLAAAYRDQGELGADEEGVGDRVRAPMSELERGHRASSVLGWTGGRAR